MNGTGQGGNVWGKMVVGVMAALFLAACGSNGPTQADMDATQAERDAAQADIGAAEAELAAANDRADASETRADRASEQAERLQQQVDDLLSEVESLTAQVEGRPDPDAEDIPEGQPFTLGEFRILITGQECMNGFSIDRGEYLDPFEETAEGQFCTVDMQIENVGNQPDNFPGMSEQDFWLEYRARDTAGRQHVSAPSEWDYMYEQGSGTLNPGQTRELSFLFDIPRDVTVEAVVWNTGESSLNTNVPAAEWVGQGDVEWNTVD